MQKEKEEEEKEVEEVGGLSPFKVTGYCLLQAGMTQG